MATKTIEVSVEDIQQMKRDIEFIKDQFGEETELTDWAKKELDKARKSPKESYVSHEEVKKMIRMK